MSNGAMMQNYMNLMIALHLHWLIISISTTLGIWLWNVDKNLFYFNFRRLFSYFFLMWSFDQLLGGFFIGWFNDIEQKMTIFTALSSMMNQTVFNKETFDSIYPSFFGFLFWSRCLNIFMNAVYLSLGFAMWNPSCPLKTLSLKRLISVLFFIIVFCYFMSQISTFLYRATR